MQVAGARGVYEQGPRHVAAVLGRRGVLAAQADEARVHEEVLQHLLEHAGVDVGPQALQQHHPVVVGVVDDLVEQGSLFHEVVLGNQRVHGFEHLGQLHVGVASSRVCQQLARYGRLRALRDGLLRG